MSEAEGLSVTLTAIARTYWEFGTVVRVDWDELVKDGRATKPDRDDRRWMVLTTPYPSATRGWTLLFLGGNTPEPVVSHWSSMHGFVKVEA